MVPNRPEGVKVFLRDVNLSTLTPTRRSYRLNQMARESFLNAPTSFIRGFPSYSKLNEEDYTVAKAGRPKFSGYSKAIPKPVSNFTRIDKSFYGPSVSRQNDYYDNKINRQLRRELALKDARQFKEKSTMPRGRKRKDTAPSGVPIMIVNTDTNSSGAAKRGRKPGSMSRARAFGARYGGRKKLAGRTAELSYKAVTGDLGVQVGCFAGEAMLSLLGTGIDFVTDSTESTSDDMVAQYGKPIIGNAIRYIAGKYVSRKNPGLAAVMSASASAWNGQSWGTYFRKHAVFAAAKVVAKSQ